MQRIPIYRVASSDVSVAATLLQADVPAEMVPRGLLGPALLANLFVSKWMDHLPYHRQEYILARAGLALERSVMCRAEKECAKLAKMIVEAARKDAIANAHIIGTDATGTLP